MSEAPLCGGSEKTHQRPAREGTPDSGTPASCSSCPVSSPSLLTVALPEAQEERESPAGRRRVQQEGEAPAHPSSWVTGTRPCPQPQGALSHAAGSRRECGQAHSRQGPAPSLPFPEPPKSLQVLLAAGQTQGQACCHHSSRSKSSKTCSSAPLPQGAPEDVCTRDAQERHTQTRAHRQAQPGPRPLRWTSGTPGVRALRGHEAQRMVQLGARPPPTTSSTQHFSPLGTPSTGLTAGRTHGEEAGRSHLWPARLHPVCGLLQLVHQGQGPSHVQNLRLSVPQGHRPALGRMRPEADETGRAPGALAQPPGLPLCGPSFSLTARDSLLPQSSQM